jgi:hypothetical protein
MKVPLSRGLTQRAISLQGNEKSGYSLDGAGREEPARVLQR